MRWVQDTATDAKILLRYEMDLSVNSLAAPRIWLWASHAAVWGI
jgi:hypothetical protein